MNITYQLFGEGFGYRVRIVPVRDPYAKPMFFTYMYGVNDGHPIFNGDYSSFTGGTNPSPTQKMVAHICYTDNGPEGKKIWVDYGPEDHICPNGTFLTVDLEANNQPCTIMKVQPTSGETSWLVYDGDSFNVTTAPNSPYAVWASGLNFKNTLIHLDKSYPGFGFAGGSNLSVDPIGDDGRNPFAIGQTDSGLVELVKQLEAQVEKSKRTYIAL